MGKALIDTEKVHIITWDSIEYDREATPWEIAKYKKEGILKVHKGSLVFDFR